MSGTCLKFFETIQNNYVYDAWTGRILECDPLTRYVLERYGQTSSEEILRTAEPQDRDSIRARLKAIDELREREGVFDEFKGFKHNSPARMLPVQNIHGLVVELTDRCNLRCKYCIFGEAYADCRVYGSDTVTVEDAIRSFELMMGTKTMDADTHAQVTFFGGEPFLEIDVMRRIAAGLRSRYPEIALGFNLTTNGSFINEEIVETLVEHNMLIWISLDGPERIHDYNRCAVGGKGTFRSVMNTLRYLREYDASYFNRNVNFVSVIAYPYGLKERARFFAECPELPDNFMLRVTDRARQEEMFKDGEAAQFAREFREAWADFQARLADPGFTKEQYLSRENLFWRQALCSPLRTYFKRPVAYDREFDGVLHKTDCLSRRVRLYVSARGELYLCIPATYYADRRYMIGNVREGFQEEAIRRILERWIAFSREHCRTCWAARLCSMCFAMMRYEDSERICGGIRNQAEEWLSRIAELKEMRPDIVELVGHENNYEEIKSEEIVAAIRRRQGKQDHPVQLVEGSAG